MNPKPLAQAMDDMTEPLAQAAFTNAVFEAGAKGRVVLQHDRSVVIANGAAKAEFARADCICVADGRVQFANRRFAEEGAKFLVTGWRRPTWMLAVSTRSGEPPLCMQAVRLHADGATLNLVKFWRMRPQAVVRLAPIAQMFNLTRAERRIVAHALTHDTANAIADAAGVKLGTVNTHLKRIYLKLGVRSRTELLRNVLSLLE